MNYMKSLMSESMRKECLFQFGMAQPFIPPSPAGNFYNFNLEQLWNTLIQMLNTLCAKPNAKIIIPYFEGSLVRLEFSLRKRRLEVVGVRKKGRARGRHARGEGEPALKAHELSLAHEMFGV